MKRFYEIACLLSSKLDEQELQKAQAHLKEIIEKAGGEIKQALGLKRIRLAYPIQKENEAYLADFEFYLESSNLLSLKETIQKENKILRFIVVKRLEKKEKPTATQPKQSLSQKSSPKKVELKDLDKKLEEILNK